MNASVSAASRRRLAVVLVAASVLLAGCRFDGLAFREDGRVQITRPEDRSTVTLPVTLEWSVDDFEVTGPTGEARPGAGYFAVLVDRAPPPPGEELAWLVRHDDTCAASPTCPDGQYLAERGVFTTSGTQLTVDTLVRPTRRNVFRELHEVTIVLLDGKGRRIGEGAFSVEFEVDRGST